MALRILITNISLWPPSGTAVYVRDLALELKRQGHAPAVFSGTHGSIADELRGAGITVSDRMDRLPRPEVIQAHHRAPALIALRRWPGVPAMYVCHDHTSPYDAPPMHPSIRKYFGVSRVCVRRLLDAGVSESRAALLLNFVDTARFRPRERLPDRPRRALVFSNYAQADTHLPAVLEACRESAIEVDVVGEGVDRLVARPERRLLEYDLVFAKAKAAMEAMAVGNAVVLCDFAGVGPMVTSANFSDLRPLNFGFEALRDPLGRAPLLREMGRYDPSDAARVRARVRSEASLKARVEEIVEIYEELVGDRAWAAASARRPSSGSSSFRESTFLRIYWLWQRVPRRRREMLKAVPGARAVLAGLRRLG